MSGPPVDNLLAIDSSTRRLHLAVLYAGDRMVKSTGEEGNTHAQVMMKRIDDLLVSAELKPGDLHGIVVSVGPGSFTGLRIGLAAAKGIAVACEIPILGVGLFELAAAKLSDRRGAAAVIVLMRRDEYYLFLVDDVSAGESTVTVVKASDLARAVAEREVYGIGFDPRGKLTGSEGLHLAGELAYDASDLLYLGRTRLARGERSDLASLEPFYLQKAIAEIRFYQRYGPPHDGTPD